MTNLQERQFRPATLKPATPDGETIDCAFESLDGKRLILHAAQRFAASTAVSIQCEDVMFLGDVMRCTPEAGDNWHLEIKVHQMLTGLQNLMNLRARLLEEGAGQAAGSVPVPVMVPVRKAVPRAPA